MTKPKSLGKPDGVKIGTLMFKARHGDADAKAELARLQVPISDPSAGYDPDAA